VVLDLHWSDSNQFGKNNGQHEMPDDHSTSFWNDVATRYKNNSAVVFDLYNEPHSITWSVWRDGGTLTENGISYHTPGMQGLLNTIRKTVANNVVFAEGKQFGQDLSNITKGSALTDSSSGHGVGYEAHLYPIAAEDNAGRDNVVAATAAKYPLFVGEWGTTLNGDQFTGTPKPDAATWTKNMLNWLDQHKYAWTAWSLHPKTSPVLISDWNYTPTSYYGQFVHDYLVNHPGLSHTASNPVAPYVSSIVLRTPNGPATAAPSVVDAPRLADTNGNETLYLRSSIEQGGQSFTVTAHLNSRAALGEPGGLEGLGFLEGWGIQAQDW
jgi:hypothetical protein